MTSNSFSVGWRGAGEGGLYLSPASIRTWQVGQREMLTDFFHLVDLGKT